MQGRTSAHLSHDYINAVSAVFESCQEDGVALTKVYDVFTEVLAQHGDDETLVCSICVALHSIIQKGKEDSGADMKDMSVSAAALLKQRELLMHVVRSLRSPSVAVQKQVIETLDVITNYCRLATVPELIEPLVKSILKLYRQANPPLQSGKTPSQFASLIATFIDNAAAVKALMKHNAFSVLRRLHNIQLHQVSHGPELLFNRVRVNIYAALVNAIDFTDDDPKLRSELVNHHGEAIMSMLLPRACQCLEHLGRGVRRHLRQNRRFSDACCSNERDFSPYQRNRTRPMEGHQGFL